MSAQYFAGASTEPPASRPHTWATYPFFIAFSVLLFSLVLIILYEIAVDPGNGFLKPAFHGNWILAPQRVTAPMGDACHAAIFTKTFSLPPDSGWKRPVFAAVSASCAFQLRINGRLISGTAEDDLNRNWKFSWTFDISEALQPGDNILDLAVRNNSRLPALLVSGYLNLQSGQTIRLDTDTSWRVSPPFVAGGTGEWSSPDPVAVLHDFYPGHLAASPLTRDSSGTMRFAAAIAAFLFIGIAIILYRRDSKHLPLENACRPDTVLSGKSATSRRGYFALLVLFAALSIPMAVIRAPDSGWDAQGHIDYIRYWPTAAASPWENRAGRCISRLPTMFWPQESINVFCPCRPAWRL